MRVTRKKRRSLKLRETEDRNHDPPLTYRIAELPMCASGGNTGTSLGVHSCSRHALAVLALGGRAVQHYHTALRRRARQAGLVGCITKDNTYVHTDFRGSDASMFSMGYQRIPFVCFPGDRFMKRMATLGFECQWLVLIIIPLPEREPPTEEACRNSEAGCWG